MTSLCGYVGEEFVVTQETELSHCKKKKIVIRHFLQSCEKRRLSSPCLLVLPVLPSARTPARNNSAPIQRIFMKFDIRVFLEKSVEKIQVLKRI